MDNSGLLTVKEVAERLNISRYQVYRRITRGDLPAKQTREGNMHYVITEQAVQDYIAAGGADVLTSPRLEDLGMMRVSEVALATGFSVEVIRRMCKEGRLACTRGNGPKGHMRIPRSAVQKLLAGLSD